MLKGIIGRRREARQKMATHSRTETAGLWTHKDERIKTCKDTG